MKEGASPKIRGFLGRLTVSLLAVSLLFLSYPGPLAEHDVASFHDGLVEPGPLDDTAGVPSELALYKAPVDNDPIYLLASLAVDEDFVKQVGNGWEDHLHEMVEGANARLSEIGLRIQVASLQQWHSDDSEESIASHLDSARDQVWVVPGHLLVTIVCQETVRYDGWARPSRDQLIVRFYHSDERRNSALLAHEVGHLLGARHHEDDEECTGEGCIMDASGYAHATTWCDHHQEIIQESIAARLASL